MPSASIYQLLQKQAERHPGAVAIAAPTRTPLTYAGLWEHIQLTANRLRELGIGRRDRVAVVMPNGPEMATSFLAAASAATCAPLNPNYRTAEFDFYLSDLNAKALIVGADMASPAIEAAQGRNIPVVELSPNLDQEAGLFTLNGNSPRRSTLSKPAQPDDVALVLHTSGTTSRPKIVPLTHHNLCTSARNIGQTLQLGIEDRCLNIMPLFHIHGLMAALLASLAAGGCVVCTPGFYAPKFFDWLAAHKPTWYTAVPTMHQAILARSAAYPDIIAHNSLRFIRSSSSSLAPQVMKSLEETFNAPVIEAYGMTEAAHQMASNPLPPLSRKPGSVGLSAGPEVAIMHETEDNLLSFDEIGEIVIRGTNVTPGYANNPEANQKAFTSDGWFRTGDQGRLDQASYLYITGRLKEIINRGGEKISPREVDEVLLTHPEIIQVVTFAMPDEQLGETVAAAVTLSADSETTELDIRRCAAEHLADFKVPQRVIILDEIPKGPTGKLQRIGLAEKLGLTGDKMHQAEKAREYVAPRNDVEELLAEIWVDVLGLDKVGVYDRFLDLGGDSVTATRLVARMRQTLELELTLLDFFEAPTISEQASIVESRLLQELDT